MRNARRGPGSSWPAPPLSSMATTLPSPSPTWLTRSPPRSECSRRSRAQSARHEAEREKAYLAVDQHLRPHLPGRREGLGGPVLVAAMGRPGRFPRAASFRRFTGLTPRASETGESDAKGQVMSKAGANWLRDQLVMSANMARQIDPELARTYYVQMVERGVHHNKAVCVVAARLADRAWVTMSRQEPYVLRDLDGSRSPWQKARRSSAKLQSPRRGAPTQTDEEDSGEGPSSARGTIQVSLTRRRQTRRPSPRASFVLGREGSQGVLSSALDKGLLNRVTHLH